MSTIKEYCDQCGELIKEGEFVWYEKGTYCSEECRDISIEEMSNWRDK